MGEGGEERVKRKKMREQEMKKRKVVKSTPPDMELETLIINNSLKFTA